ncbi:MAG: ATP-binding protein [Bacilli bacterium]|nr:ATP-binding protein [Bacilli bacterium]
MIGKIVSIKDYIIYIQLSLDIYKCDNLISKNITFADRYIGEVMSMSGTMMEVRLIGEIINNRFVSGSINMPPFNASCRLTTLQEIDIIYGIDRESNIVKVGKSSLYQDYDVYLNINSFFSSHFSILGNTGSGKSHFVAGLLQSVFYNSKRLPFNPNIFLFDAYGEYQQAFENINKVNSNLNFKVITTDLREDRYDKLKLPFWLLSVDDICLLLEVDDARQIPIVEKALKLVSFFSQNNSSVLKHKNDIIARCLLDIIFSSNSVNEIRNTITTVLTKFNTDEINLEVNLTKGGWTRTLRQCIYVGNDGKFADIEVVIDYLEKYCEDNFELSLPDGSYMYTINDFYTSLEFALISEGVFSNSTVFEYANILKIRLNSLINSDYVNYFKCNKYMNKTDYIKYLLTASNGGKCQIIDFNINYVDDRFAKVIVKIFSKMIFDYVVRLSKRASMPFHIVLEEAHRYVQDDIDRKILGYNIFERITKEGRKYGILLGMISQRPSELSETAVSQCSNFAVFRTFHPRDIEFISSVISGMSEGLIQRVKCLNPGGCVLFGTAFKFPILTMVDMPEPTPLSQSCDIDNTWYIN